MTTWYELQDLTLWSLNCGFDLKLDMYMWTPSGNIVKIWQNLKISHFDAAHPRGRWCQRSVSNPLMNVQSKFGYYKFGYPNFQYNTWYASGTELRTSRRTDDHITRYHRQTFFARRAMFHIHVLYSYCNLALMQALTIYLRTRCDMLLLSLSGLCSLTATIMNVHGIYISK